MRALTGWTGGQYSLCRALLGLAIAARVLSFLTARGALDGALLLGLAALAAALLFAAGWRDRLMAALLLLLLPLVVAIGEVAVTAGSWGAAWLLVTHLAVPSAPFGSLAARGRVDPRGGWSMPPALPWLHRPAFLALAAALLRRGGGGFDLAVALGLALLAFDPGWIPGRAPAGPEARQAGRETLYYDGTCGLCHASVRFFIAEDPAERLRFGTLEGRSFRRALGPRDRAGLPDSLVLVTGDDRVLTRSRGVRHALATIGGYWRVIAGITGLVPVRVADAAYDLVARARHRLFRRPPEACPLIPKGLRGRFLPD